MPAPQGTSHPEIASALLRPQEHSTFAVPPGCCIGSKYPVFHPGLRPSQGTCPELCPESVPGPRPHPSTELPARKALEERNERNTGPAGNQSCRDQSQSCFSFPGGGKSRRADFLPSAGSCFAGVAAVARFGRGCPSVPAIAVRGQSPPARPGPPDIPVLCTEEARFQSCDSTPNRWCKACERSARTPQSH